MEATGTAGNLLGLAVPFELRSWEFSGSSFVPKDEGTAEPAVMEATGETLPVV